MEGTDAPLLSYEIRKSCPKHIGEEEFGKVLAETEGKTTGTTGQGFYNVDSQGET